MTAEPVIDEMPINRVVPEKGDGIRFGAGAI